MRLFAAALAALVLGITAPHDARANCADDAIDTCNEKHPDPNASEQAYELYELCIKAQLGQSCPNNAPAANSVLADLDRRGKAVPPRCPGGRTLKVDWDGSKDLCVHRDLRVQPRAARGMGARPVRDAR